MGVVDAGDPALAASAVGEIGRQRGVEGFDFAGEVALALAGGHRLALGVSALVEQRRRDLVKRASEQQQSGDRAQQAARRAAIRPQPQRGPFEQQ